MKAHHRTFAAIATVLMLASAGCGDEQSEAEKAVESVATGSGLPELADEAPPPKVSWSRGGAELLFSSDRDGNSRIYRTRGADTTWTDLTGDQHVDGAPVWSPDGSRIAFQREVRIQRGPEWFEDNLDIFVMNADGSDVVRLTDNPADDFMPSWSPDGTRITFLSWRQEARDSVLVNRRLPRPKHHVYIMNADGSDPRRFFAQTMVTDVSWAPGGEALAFAREEGDSTDVYLCSPAGDVIRRLTADSATNASPAFSPDGRFVAFHSDHGDRSEIVVVDRWALKRETVVAAGKNRHPRWSPDGEWLVYSAAGADGDSDIRAVHVDTGDTIILTSGPGREGDASWRPVATLNGGQ